MGNQCTPFTNRSRQRSKYQNRMDNFLVEQNYRTVSIKISTYFAKNSFDYYSNLIHQIDSQNVFLHLNMKISSYLADDQSYTNISQILSHAHNASILSLDFSNSLLRKRMIFKILKQRLQEFHYLRGFDLNIGFTYIPNSTMKIFLSALSSCRSITKLKLDFQIDIFIKQRQDKKEDKKFLPNDKITYLVAHSLISCKNIQYVSLNFSQIQQKDQDYNSFFKEFKNGQNLLSLELILNNCGLDDLCLEQIGQILYQNKQLQSFYLHLSNNNFKLMNSLYKTYIKPLNLQVNQNQNQDFLSNKLQNFRFVSNGFQAKEQDLAEFIQSLSFFPNLKSLGLHLNSSHNNDIQLFTKRLNDIIKNLISISLDFNMFGDNQNMRILQKNKFLNYWRKKKRMVNIKNSTYQ